MTHLQTSNTPMTVDWEGAFARWERQQSSYIAQREERYDVMLKTLESVAGPECTVIDLMCGPGAITRRVLDRLPRARVIAIDLDPVLLAIGRHVHGDGDGRVTWIEANLKHESWVELLPLSQVDAVLSTTAIHWLFAGEIVDLYRTLARLIRPGGLFLNGDQMKFVARQPALGALAATQRDAHRAEARAGGAEDWESWWFETRREAGLSELFSRRDRLFSWRTDERERAIGSQAEEISPRVNVHTTFPVHHAALLDAGFSEVDTIWQHFDSRLLAAIR